MNDELSTVLIQWMIGILIISVISIIAVVAVAKMFICMLNYYNHQYFLRLRETESPSLISNITDIKDDVVGKMNIECPICLQILSSNAIYTRCNHYFHKTCLDEWIATSYSNSRYFRCPICRAKYNI